MSPAEIVGRALCFLGHHDWFVSRSQTRYEVDDGCLQPMILVLMCLTLFLVVWLVMMFVRPLGAPVLLFLGSSVVIATLHWAVSFYFRGEKRVDAQCLRCNKRKLEVTRREESKTRTGTFFDELNNGSKK